MILTKELFAAGKSDAGGYNLAQLKALGIPMPPKGWPKAGWPSRVVGKEISPETYSAFMELRGKRKKKRLIETEEMFHSAETKSTAREIFTIQLAQDSGGTWTAICAKLVASGIGSTPSAALESLGVSIDSTLLTMDRFTAQ